MVAQKKPGKHGMGCDMPVEPQKLPIGLATAAVLPARQYEPRGQTFALALPIGQNVPFPHGYWVGVVEPAQQ